jgi:hypothetical protein
VNRRHFLTSSACACVAAATANVGSLIAAPLLPASVRATRCGTKPPTPAEKIQASRVTTALRTNRVSFGRTSIPIRFHIVHEGNYGYVPHPQLQAQVDLLNKVYAPAQLNFHILDVDTHNNSFWFYGEPGSEAEFDMKTKIGKDTQHSLNIYTAEPGGLLGYAAFPWWMSEWAHLDGVVLHHASLPNRAQPYGNPPWPYDLGMTAVHEVGHWAGLFHTFQDGCQAPGDEIDDTPYEQDAATGCPMNQPSICPGESRYNPVHNYMDYSDDACMNHFTPQQVARIKEMVGFYRYELTPQTMRSQKLAAVRAAVGY